MAAIGKHRDIESGHCADVARVWSGRVYHTVCEYLSTSRLNRDDAARFYLNAGDFSLTDDFYSSRLSGFCESHRYAVWIRDTIPGAKGRPQNSVNVQARREPGRFGRRQLIYLYAQALLHFNVRVKCAPVILG